MNCLKLGTDRQKKTKPRINKFDKSNKKRAVLVGLNYTGTRAALKGCINDARRMKKTLVSKYKYNNVTILSDKNITPKNDILLVLNKLVLGNENHLFFQYSGHGTQVVDMNKDEIDGKDEALYSTNGRIVRDDDINDVIKKVKPSVNMVIFIDACHSGSVIDLPYQLVDGKIVKVNNNQIDGNIICISGCKDEQVSMDVTIGLTSYGALSNALQVVLNKNEKGISWRLLVEQVKEELSKEEYAQIPQLSVSSPELIDSMVTI